MAQTAISLERAHAEPRGLGSWLTTVDHKRIGILYFVSSFLFFLVGGLMAPTMRTQLMVPENDLVNPHVFNQLFTTHGLIMIFLFVMPMNSGLGTVWGGSITINTPLLYAAGFVGIFTIGGITGIMHASVPIDYQQSDTYFIVAHFHYVVAGIAFAVFGAIYYWFPKFFGRMMNDKMGQIQFWLTLIGFNVTFFPMHFTGVDGMSRRYFTYQVGQGFDTWNMVSTIGAYLLGLAVLMRAWTSGPKAPADPWDGRTLEWTMPSPPPVYNFAEMPAVRVQPVCHGARTDLVNGIDGYEE
jgi:heme/copper-type cytochrome/quinol oxidase subunit 1